MKTKSNFLKTLLAALSLLLTISCNDLINCSEIKSSEVRLIIDVSDAELYKEISSDIEQNIGHFMTQTEFAKMAECSIAKLTVGNLSGKEELNKRSAEMSLTQKGLSGARKRELNNPKEIMHLLKSSLEDYSKLSEDPSYNSGTAITQTLVKGAMEMNEISDNTLVVFSDMVINNKKQKINFYRNIPTDIDATLHKLIDEHLRKNLKEKIEQGYSPKIIICLKEDPKGKVSKRKVKAFWIEALSQLGFEDIQIIDNLSNDIKLWD